MKYHKLEFRAVTINKKGVETQYTSHPIQKAEELYTTVGLYETVRGVESPVHKHIADMSIEDFEAVIERRFPNGFGNWQETYFEIVERMSSLKDKDLPKFLRELQSRYDKSDFYIIAKDYADKFEKKNKGRFWDVEFSEEVGEFVAQKINEVENMF